jgi:CRP-like cAMP-binding protein
MTIESNNPSLENPVNYSPWLKIDDYNWDSLTKGKKSLAYKKNDVIYHQQTYTDFVYLVKSGRVRLSIYSKDGREKSLFIADKNCLFGELSAFDNLPNHATAMAVADSEVYHIPKTLFIECLKVDHDLSLKTIEILARKNRLLAAQIEDLSFNDAYTRVAIALIKLSLSYSSDCSDGNKLEIKFTHQEMANLLGLSRVSVSKIMSDFIKLSILEKKDGYIVLKDVKKLKDWIG